MQFARLRGGRVTVVPESSSFSESAQSRTSAVVKRAASHPLLRRIHGALLHSSFNASPAPSLPIQMIYKPALPPRFARERICTFLKNDCSPPLRSCRHASVSYMRSCHVGSWRKVNTLSWKPEAGCETCEVRFPRAMDTSMGVLCALVPAGFKLLLFNPARVC